MEDEEFKMQDTRYRIQDRMQDTGCRIQDAGCRIQYTGYWIILKSGYQKNIKSIINNFSLQKKELYITQINLYLEPCIFRRIQDKRYRIKDKIILNSCYQKNIKSIINNFSLTKERTLYYPNQLVS
mgnify:CR=1 FL=1